MKKSLPLLVAVLAIALIGSSAFAYAPVIQPLPQVFIGDAEDNAGTVDNNLFRFSNAFDLDAYVTDGDTTISELAWSFIEDPLVIPDMLEVNGITQLASESDALDPAAVGKDIRHQAAPFDDSWVDFWDLEDSPKPLAVPYLPPSPGLNTIVTFFCSDGTFVDSADCEVQIVDNGTDYVSDVTVWTQDTKWDYEGDVNGWTFTGPNATAADAVFTGATSSYDGSKLGTSTDNTTSRFGFWTAPSAIAFETGKLYKYEWKGVDSSLASSTNDPTLRFRINSTDFSTAFEMVISSVGTDPPFAPTTTPRDYNMYFLPVGGHDMVPAFDVYDFDASDAGQLNLDELVVWKATLPTADWSAETVPAFGTWTALTSISPYGSVTSGTSGGLQLTTTVGNGFNYGFWTSTNLPMAADTLYRVLPIVSSSDANPPECYIRVNSQDFQVTYRYKASGASVAPDSDGEVYPVYFESHDMVSGAEGFNIGLEIFDGDSTTRGGTITLTTIVAESHALLP